MSVQSHVFSRCEGQIPGKEGIEEEVLSLAFFSVLYFAPFAIVFVLFVCTLRLYIMGPCHRLEVGSSYHFNLGHLQRFTWCCTTFTYMVLQKVETIGNQRLENILFTELQAFSTPYGYMDLLFTYFLFKCYRPPKHH